MGIFDWIFKRPRADIKADGYFRMLTGYQPIFTSAPGSVYEMAQTRSAIHAFASNCAKLKIELVGGVKKELAHALAWKPNPVQDSFKFLYRIATILSIHNTCFIVPIENEYQQTVGLYPLVPLRCEIVEHHGAPFLRYTFGNGRRAAIEMERVGILTGFQSKSDVFGDSNDALRATMELMHAQNESITQSVRNSAAIRFLVKVSGLLKEQDLRARRKQFVEENLRSDDATIFYDSNFADVKQIESKPFVIDEKQADHIKSNVYSYFGVSEAVIQNKFTEDEWNAFYEGRIEPFAIQLSLVLTGMLFTPEEIEHGSRVVLSANRLQYASNESKLKISTQLLDRGILTRNQVLEIWNLPPVEGGDKYYIRKEYTEINELGKESDDAVSTERERI